MKSKSFFVATVLGVVLSGGAAAAAEAVSQPTSTAVASFLRDPEHCVYMVDQTDATNSEYERKFTAAAKAAVAELAAMAPVTASSDEALFALLSRCVTSAQHPWQHDLSDLV